MARTKFISNQIDRIYQEVYLTGDGVTEIFAVGGNIWFSNPYDPNASADIQVYENGVLCKRYGTGANYAVHSSTGSYPYDGIKFVDPPTNGHLIVVRYRIENA
jgi:hypothetical protein